MTQIIRQRKQQQVAHAMDVAQSSIRKYRLIEDRITEIAQILSTDQSGIDYTFEDHWNMGRVGTVRERKDGRTLIQIGYCSGRYNKAICLVIYQ